MAKNVVIVESPAKAKTIEKYMGKDYKVVASHWPCPGSAQVSDFGIEVNGGVNIKYVASRTANAQVRPWRPSRRQVSGAETVWLATDPDREGEAIAWHVAER